VRRWISSECLEQRYGGAEGAAEATPDDEARRRTLTELDCIRIERGGKPIASRDARYDETRGSS